MDHLLHTISLLAIMPLLALAGCAPEPQTRSDTPADIIASSTATFGPGGILAPTPLPPSEELPATPGTKTWPDCSERQGGAARQYQVNAVVDWANHSISAEQQIVFHNTSTKSLGRLVLTAEPNQLVGQFTMKRVTDHDGKALAYTLDGSRLTIPLNYALPPNCAAMLTLDFELVLSPVREGYQWGRLGYLGYTDRQLNLGMWLPLVAAYHPFEGWLTPTNGSTGEHFALEIGDFDISLEVTNAPESLQLAAPGRVTQKSSATWHITSQNAREVALSLSTQYFRLNTKSPSGVEVQVYYLSSPGLTLDAPRHVLHSATDALALFEDLFAPYPYDTLTIVQGDFPDGMEFSGLVFVSDDWFRMWQGIPNDWLTLITVHEVAHQWWYALVGSNQQRFPYQDEALAIYSELLFLERYYPDYIPWWWSFRVTSYDPQGFVDTPVTGFDNVRSYINAVYLRGALMLQAVRDTLGDTVFFTWLHVYAERMAGQLADPSDLWGCLGAENYAATRPIRDTFFAHTDPVAMPFPTNVP